MSYTYGLIGKTLGYSFSKGYFTKKFKELGLEETYGNFELPDISHFPGIFEENPDIIGLNVTIPYKQEIMSFMDVILPEAQEIGAINTIKRTPKGLYGFNSDVHGFAHDVRLLLDGFQPEGAIILGTGGASRAVHYALKKILGVKSIIFLSRTGNRRFLEEEVISYEEADQLPPSNWQLVINTTPLGTYPNVEEVPLIPFERFTGLPSHAYDLVYNPEQTSFLHQASKKGAKTRNGLGMLIGQAEKSWEFWKTFTP